jgi:DNA-binding IclR family transcriptional regulator
MDTPTDDDEPDRPQQGVQSVETGLHLLAALAAAGRPLALADLARGAGMAPAKAHRYLVSLIRAGMAERRPDTGRYDLGPAALGLGLAALGRLDAEGLAGAALADLRDALDETVCLVTWGPSGPTVLRVELAGRSVAVNVRAGSVLAPLRSASGRALLAWRPERAADPDFAAEFAADAAALGLDAAAIDRLLADIRAAGLAGVEGTQLPGVAALAAPVFDHGGRAVFALTALGPAGALDTAPDGATARRLRTAAERLSGRLGHRIAG